MELGTEEGNTGTVTEFPGSGTSPKFGVRPRIPLLCPQFHHATTNPRTAVLELS
jgi:hypothetical protein